MGSFAALSPSEKERYESLIIQHRAKRKANRAYEETRKRKEIEKRNRRYNRFVMRMEKKRKNSKMSIGKVARFMGVDNKELREFYKNKNRARKIDYKYAYSHCLLFAKNYVRAEREMLLSGNPPTGDITEDKLLALLELVTGMNLTPDERLSIAQEYIDTFQIDF